MLLELIAFVFLYITLTIRVTFYRHVLSVLFLVAYCFAEVFLLEGEGSEVGGQSQNGLKHFFVPIPEFYTVHSLILV